MSGRGFAQQDYFILIQSDNNQVFYARLGDRTINSSDRGFMILSQLKDSSYVVKIGLPGRQMPEASFTLVINKKDLEFQLKDLGEKGLALFNPKTLELKTSDTREAPDKGYVTGIKKDDAFSRMMAAVVGDTAVMYNTYAMETMLKDSAPPAPKASPEIVAASGAPVSSLTAADSVRKASSTGMNVSVADSSGAVATLRNSTQEGVIPVRSVPAAPPVMGQDSIAGSLNTGYSRDSNAMNTRKTDVIHKISERRTAKFVRLVYSDHVTGGTADTIVVIIPVDSGANLAQHHPDLREKGQGMKNDAGGNSSLSSNKPDSLPKKGQGELVLVNSDCRNFASDYDVDKLRVKMLEADKDDDRIAAARKVFRSKCFTTKQVRALSEVFTSDAVKYRFFEMAYPFVSDDHFRELSDLLVDPVYNGKFKAMVGQR